MMRTPPHTTASGDLDIGFGNKGIVYPLFSDREESMAYGVALQPDGKILIAGVIARNRFGLTRLNNDGSLDTSFGHGGTIIDVFETDSVAAGSSVHLLSNERILLIGTSTNGNGTFPALARFDKDGNVDISFGKEGKTVVPLPKGGSRFDAGGSKNTPTTPAINGAVMGNYIFVKNRYESADGDYELIARLQEHGDLDKSFGGRGYVRVKHPQHSTYINALLAGPDGDVLAAGSVDTESSFYGLLTHYSREGIPDDAFGENGFVVLDEQGGNTLDGVVRSAGNTIIGLGSTTSPNKGILIGRTSTGGPDKQFNHGEMVFNEFTPEESAWTQAQVSASSSIVVAGYTEGGEEADVIVAHYLANGTLDSRFGRGNGWVRTKVGKSIDIAYALALQTDNKIVVCGMLFKDVSFQAFALRYIG